HHIYPRALCELIDRPDWIKANWNIVKLRARDHFVCHLLLIEMLLKKSIAYYKMSHAPQMMANRVHKTGYEVTPEEYEKSKIMHSNAMSELNKKRVKDGTHHLLGGAIQRKLVEDGLHPL